MRKIKVLSIICLALLAIVGCRKKEINKLKDEVNDLKTRVTVLEETCRQNNTNIVSLQTIVNASTEGDYITSITPITKDGVEIGYTIAFKNQKPITIYNGTNGTSPTIGVTNVDGNYYWTLNGELLLDENDNKIRVTGENGAKPNLKIEDGNWYVSYDDGSSWNFVSNVKDGLGGAVFNEVTYDENFVYFTLADGTQIKIARQDAVAVSTKDGAILAEFSVSETKKVYFSQGNLQYQASTNTWRFAENQWDYVGDANNGTVFENTEKSDNANISDSYSGWIDLFGWGTSGYDDKNPYMTNTEADYGNGINDISGTNYDWGVYNKINNGGNQTGEWRTLTKEEWNYVINTRNNASDKKGLANVNGIPGLVVLPDNWTLPDGISFTNGANDDFSQNTYSSNDWSIMEENGAVFLPNAGHRYVTVVHGAKSNDYEWSYGYYWSSSYSNNKTAYAVFVCRNAISAGESEKYTTYEGFSVRLVRDVE